MLTLPSANLTILRIVISLDIESLSIRACTNCSNLGSPAWPDANAVCALKISSTCGGNIYYMCILVRAERIELSSKRWQRSILPLNYARYIVQNRIYLYTIQLLNQVL